MLVLAIPTLNAGKFVPNLFKSINSQSVPPETLLAIDSSSDDNTVDVFKNFGFKTHQIPRSSFDHGGTRQLALSLYPIP